MYRVAVAQSLARVERKSSLILRLAALVILVGLQARPTPALPPALPMDLVAHNYFPTSPQIIATEHFELIQEGDSSWSRPMGDLLEALYGHFFREMRSAGFDVNEPDEALTWICFGDRTRFGAYAGKTDHFDPSWLDEYYSPRTNRVAMLIPPASVRRLDPARISHEAAHQLSYSSGLLVQGVMYPVWISEGVATNFESEDGVAARKAQLIDAVAQGGLLPIGQFVVMARFRPDEGYDLADAYAQSAGLFRFLLQRHPDELQDYLAQLSRLEAGERDAAQLSDEFKKAFGSFASIESAWLASLEATTSAK